MKYTAYIMMNTTKSWISKNSYNNSDLLINTIFKIIVFNIFLKNIMKNYIVRLNFNCTIGYTSFYKLNWINKKKSLTFFIELSIILNKSHIEFR